MQWGTPDDVAEYRNWSNAFHRLCAPRRKPLEMGGAVVVPMAGLGQRFTNEGYKTTKPLIPVSGRPMVVQSTNDLPRVGQYAFVLRADMPGFEEIGRTLRREYSNARIVTVPRVTEGQACTALLGLDAITREAAYGPVTFGACDNGALYDADKFRALYEDEGADVIVWAVRGHANAARNPRMYGWIEAGTDGAIRRVSVKTPLSSPQTDPIVLGTFTFRRAGDFRRCVARMIARDGRVNGEFYIDTCINDALELGLRCRVFEVDCYLSWGTPNDLRTFEYWQSCFHKWPSHPYRLELDRRVPATAAGALAQAYAGKPAPRPA
jgi:CTP:molybdopterin cytidylyltransferase MocA